MSQSNFVYLLNTSWAAMELYQPREFKNYHEGGLLSILSCDDFELAAASSKSLPTLDHVHILLTGGYDDYFRVNR
jgi:hypothetical protein